MRSCRPYNLVIIVILLAAQFYPAAASSSQESVQEPSYISKGTVAALAMVSQLSVQNQVNTDLDVVGLIGVSENKTDTDGDGLPDSVEAVLGTDFNNTDSDFDRLDDYNESVFYRSDPLEPDSNHDGLSDYFEVMDVYSLDVDGDGYPNIWDFDNDGDCVEDNIDSSPFALSATRESFNFNLKTNGNPTYVDFQLLPQNPNNVNIALQKWDWPYDNKSTMQDLDNSEDDVQVIPMLELTMSSVPDQADVKDYGIGIFSNTAYVPLVQVQGLGANVALAGKMFFPESEPLDSQVNASLIWLVMAKTDSMENGTVISENTTLIKYQENFTLTGFSIEESYGSDIGLFYSDEINQTIAANFVMAYSFLRNNQTTVYDMPSKLAEHNVSVSSTINSSSHRDKALLNVTTRMTPGVLNSLPEDMVLPVISAIESNFAKKDLSELDSSSYMVGNGLSINLRSEPVITLKTLKTSWYNTTDQKPLVIDSILPVIRDWGQLMNLDDNSLASMMVLVIAWNIGESTVTRIGNDSTSFVNEVLDVLEVIETGIGGYLLSYSSLIDVISIATEGTYRVFFALNYVGEFIQGVLGLVMYTSKIVDKVVDVISTVAKFAEGLGKVLGIIGAITLVVGFVFDIGFAIWGFFKIAMSEGWSSTGTFQGAVYATIMGVYAISLFVIGVILLAVALIPYVGWIIALVGGIILGVIALTDFILGFFDIGISNLVEKLVGTFHQTYMNTEFSLGLINSSIDIKDYNENGFDVGDRITFSSFINGTVLRTSDGTWEDVKESYVIPHYEVKRWMTEDTPYAYWVSPYGSFTNNVSYSEINPESKNTTYEIGAWIEPKLGTINFPLAVLFTADYKIIYTDRKIEWDFWNGYKYTHLNQTGTIQNKLDTLYFDVLPGNINDFTTWYPLTSQDKDNDGLGNNVDPYPWAWDGDGDGLSDKFELDIIGSDPGSRDKDGDGLSDRMELIYGTNLTEWDTDNDNLSDYKEINGWDINFNYSGQSFNMTVKSDPLMPDTDKDGVDDQMEYWSSLNPRSKDSNGDGVVDVPNPKTFTYVNFETKWGKYGVSGYPRFDYPSAVAVDADGYVYVADSGDYSHSVQKFDSNGKYIRTIIWGSKGSGNGQFGELSDMAIDTANGYIYIADYISGTGGRIQKFDSEGNFLTSWNTGSGWGPEIAVDEEGYVYANINHCIQKFNSSGTLISNPYFSTYEGVTNVAVDLDGNVYYTDVYQVFKAYSNWTFITQFYSEGDSTKAFGSPRGLAVDDRGFVYIADQSKNHIQKFDPTGWFITRWGSYGSGDEEFISPMDIAVDANENVYVLEAPLVAMYKDTAGNRIQKFSQITDLPPRNVSEFLDSDGDGLGDMNETRGWDVTFSDRLLATSTCHVTSEFLANDTDFDGLSDFDEYNYSSNPRDVDTDGDGLNDYVESVLGTNINHYDTDNDGLDDGTEITFGSDPTKVDTDFDGLSDLEEYDPDEPFVYFSDPWNNDTDGDGLNDKDEREFNSSARNPDSDGDLMFDGTEKEKGTDPWNPDSDRDGLQDGYELLYRTNASNNDTDNDGVPDGKEVNNRMNPLNNDTDGDGLSDFEELANGTDPSNGDTKGNGLNDSEDPYSFAPNVDRIWVAYDPDDDTQQLIENLEKYTNVTVFRPDEIQNYSGKSNILLVGRPGLENNTAGNISYSILKNKPAILSRMQGSDYARFYVDYDIWKSSQTVVMLSHPYPSDHYKVLDLFKTLNQTIQYPDVVSDFKADAIEEMGSFIRVELKNPVKPSIELKSYNGTNVPENFTCELSADEKGVKFLDINVSENVMNESSNNVKRALIVIYYTAEDLDRTGDGDADDPGDIDENTIGFNWFNMSANRWEKLTTDMDWVNDVGINTTNDIIYGKEYEGYVWANVSHLSMYGLSGTEITQPVHPAPHDGHRRIPIITDEESQDENITLEDVQTPLESTENTSKETPVAKETGTLPEIWFYLAAAMVILLTGLGAAYLLRKRT